jgi:hypothetical protein|tara:strand:+ start:5515 stop:5727 length:213 start_codon:yes stop_codon:yes gene_type:complete
MRIVYQSGKLYLSLREEEKKDIVESYPKPCEIDLSLIPVLNKDLSNINEQIWKDTTAKEYQELVGTISKK